jgi:hypothetical protein
MTPPRKPTSEEQTEIAIAFLEGQRIVYDFNNDVYTPYERLTGNIVFYDLNINTVCSSSITNNRNTQ